MTTKERKFVRELETVSGDLAIWAQSKMQDGWSIDDVKMHIRHAMTVCQR